MDTSNDDKTSSDVASLKELNAQAFKAEEDGATEVLAAQLTDDFRIVRSNFSISDKQEMLEAVSTNAGKGRAVREVTVTVYGDSAVVNTYLTTGHPEVTGHFWNTRIFVKENGRWRCKTWQVARLA